MEVEVAAEAIELRRCGILADTGGFRGRKKRWHHAENAEDAEEKRKASEHKDKKSKAKDAKKIRYLYPEP